MITVLPESEGNILVIKASNKLTSADYKDSFIPKLNQLIQQFQKVRVVFYFSDTFSGWEFGAMWDDASFGLKHKNDFERIALVGAPRWVAWLTKLSAHFMPGDCKTFESNSLQEAITWVKS